LIAEEDLPMPESLGVSNAAYLDGLGESVGELRRYILDNLRRGDFSRCEELLAIMDGIYDILMTLDFPELVTHGLRRTTDAIRGIVERTRGDLTVALRQKELETKLHNLTNWSYLFGYYFSVKLTSPKVSSPTLSQCRENLHQNHHERG